VSELKMNESGRVCDNDDSRNMFGCSTCPQCNKTNRYSFEEQVCCDDCGYHEPAWFEELPGKFSWHLNPKDLMLEDPPVDGKTAIIVNDRGEYFSHWAASFSPRYDGDDDHYTTVPEWTKNYKYAYVYDNEKSAKRAAKSYKFFHRIAVVS
jgi:hypothetical protein